MAQGLDFLQLKEDGIYAAQRSGLQRVKLYHSLHHHHRNCAHQVPDRFVRGLHEVHLELCHHLVLFFLMLHHHLIVFLGLISQGLLKGCLQVAT